MAILGNIRKAGGTFVVIVISFFVIMFLGGELVRLVPYLFRGKDQIGRLFGDKISYIDYRKFYQPVFDNLTSQGVQLTEENRVFVKNYAWNQLIQHMCYMKEIEAAGMLVGPQEVVDLVQGEHIDRRIKQSFKDPKTDVFDKKQLLNYLNNLSKLSKNQQEQWCIFEKELALTRAKKKLKELFVKSSFMITSQAQQVAEQADLFCNVDYLYIPFTSIKDDLVPLTDQQLLDYMAAYKNRYTAPSESRTIQYITFPIELDETDKSDFKKNISLLEVQFASTTDPYTFAEQHTDGNVSAIKLICTVDTLPNAFSTIKDTLKEGMVIGPVVDKQFHTLYKLIKKEQDNYEIACIEKKLVVSDHTRNKHWNHLKQLTSQVKKYSDLEALAANKQLTIQKEVVAPSNHSIGSHAAARKVVCWLYDKASLGKVSPLFDLGNAYLLAIMVEQVKAGDLVPLHSVSHEVYQKVLHKEKARIILDKLKQVGATTLQSIAEAYGEGIAIQSVERLRFLENDHPSLKQAPAFVGKCFGLKLNLISDPIIDDKGIFIACVKHRDKEAIKEEHNEQMNQIGPSANPYDITKALEELAQVSDERYKIE